MDADYDFSSFSRRGLIEKNLDILKENVIDKRDKSVNILVVGSPGSGKSALTLFASGYMDQVHGLDFSLENIAFTHSQWSNSVRHGGKHTVRKHDEGRNTYNRMRASGNDYKEGADLMYQYRYKNQFRFIDFQRMRHFNFELLDGDVIHAVFRCFYPNNRSKPFMHFYSKGRASRIREKDRSKKVFWPEPNFWDEWPNPEKEIPELWKKYEDMNEEALNSEEKEGEGEEVKSSYLSTGSFADRLDISKKKVRQLCDSGEVKSKRLSSGHRRIPESEVERLLEEP